MKKRFFFLSVALTAFAFAPFAQHSAVKPAAHKSMNSPYKLENTNLKFGNSAYSMQVLNAWKAWDDGDLDRVASMFADEVWGTTADGTVIKGKADFMKGMKDFRASLASASSTVAACTTLKSAEHPDMDATCIWGQETDVKKDGTTQKMALHEVWFFNTAGKVVEWHQYSAPMKDDMK